MKHIKATYTFATMLVRVSSCADVQIQAHANDQSNILRRESSIKAFTDEALAIVAEQAKIKRSCVDKMYSTDARVVMLP